jgi:putative ABC transport system ATP-binding protein
MTATYETASSQTVLRAIGVSKTYVSTEPPTHVLKGIDLKVRAGEFLAVMGASGSGKSTLLYALSGMDRPSDGSVALEGRELTDLTDQELSQVRLTEMGFIFQQAHFLRNLNLRDNIALPALKAAGDREAAQARVDGLMNRFGIAEIGSHGITQVSGGQLQRAAICRALAVEPSVLFADEPTGALNSSMTAEVMDTLTAVHRSGTTIVMVTHDPGCASRADRVIYLSDGQVVEARELGAWSPEAATAREDELIDWLRKLGF